MSWTSSHRCRANDFLRGTSTGLSSDEVYGYDAWQVPLPGVSRPGHEPPFDLEERQL